jgi:hypothetical protein
MPAAAPILTPPTPTTPGCERGYLAPPTIDLIPADLSIPDQINMAFEIVDAYFTYHCLLMAPSPDFAVPAKYQKLLAPLGPASDEHISYIQKGIRYGITSESFFWNNHHNPVAGIKGITTPTSNALRAVMAHWDPHSVMTRILLELHDHLMDVEDLDFDPNPPPPFNPMDGFPSLLRCASGPPPGDDDYMYHGSYIFSLERCLGHRRGTFVDFHHHKETGGTDGFLRSLGRERVLPALQSHVDTLVATYKAHPISQFEPIFHRLGAPRVQYVLNPPPIAGEPTEAEQAVLDFWKPIVAFFEARDKCMGADVVTQLRDTVKGIEALKRDAEAGYYLNVLARMAPNGVVPNADIAGLIVSFLAPRLPDDAPELQLRPRHPMYTTAAIDALAFQTQDMVTNYVPFANPEPTSSSNCV